MNSSALTLVPDNLSKGPFAKLSSRPRVVIHNRKQVPSARDRWFARDAKAALRHLGFTTGPLAHRMKGLVILDAPQPEGLALLHNYFDTVVSPPTRMLPDDELLEALTAQETDERIIGGLYDLEGRRLVLHRGNFETLTIPLSWFRFRKGGPKPDPLRLAFTDWGHTVQLGDFEATADAILYDFVPEVRKRIKARERDADKSFGGALRRLRLLRGLSRADFEPTVSERTIARIESGEVETPQRANLEAIAKKLGVSPKDIHTY